MVGIKKFLSIFFVILFCGVSYPSAAFNEMRQDMSSVQLKIFDSFCSKFKEKTKKEPDQATLKEIRSVVLFKRCPVCGEFIYERGKKLRPLYLYFSKGESGELKPCAYHHKCLYGVRKTREERLHKAVKDGRDIVKVQGLLDEGADVTWYDEQWNTAYDVAKTPEIAALVKPSYWSRLKRCYRYLGQPCCFECRWWMYLKTFLLLKGLCDSFSPFDGEGMNPWGGWFIFSLMTNAYSLATYHMPASWGLREPAENKISVDGVISAASSVGASIFFTMRPFLAGGYDGVTALLLSAPTLFCDLSPLLTGQLGCPHKFWKTKTGKAIVVTAGLAAAGLWGSNSPWICSLAQGLFAQKAASLMSPSGPLPLVNATISNIAPMLSPLNGTAPATSLGCGNG